MRIVIDTNIVFSALLKKDSRELKIIQMDDIEIFIPKFLIIELFKNKEKIINVSKLNENEILESLYLILNYCRIFDEEDIPDTIKKQAFEYVKDVDPKDAVFVASALTLDADLWTGDKKLMNGLKSRGINNFLVQTTDIERKLNDGAKDS